MRICIECRGIGHGASGGVGQVALGFARGLAGLAGEDDYVFLATPAVAAVLRPYLGGPCRLEVAEDAAQPPSWRAGLRRLAHRGPTAALAGLLPVRVPVSDGRVEALKADLVHFISQAAYLTAVPSLYHPHDLQHRHLPQFFTRRQRKQRDRLYKAFADQALAVPVASAWTSRDVAAGLGLDPAKVPVVPLAPPSAAYGTPDPQAAAALRARIGAERFILYPAQTWPHKNHLGLLTALAALRRRGVVVPLVCSGVRNAFFARIQAEMAALGLADQVVFTGFVGEAEMGWLYDACAFVVVPTRFEAASGPVWEAFAAGKAVAASRVTALPDQVADAGLLFDCDDTAGMAEAIRRLWQDPALAAALGRRGRLRVAAFTWERTAVHFRALYRKVLGRPLTQEDGRILESPPML